MDRWRDTKLTNSNEKAAWDLVRLIRDFDIHTHPVPSTREPWSIPIRTAGRVIVITTREYVAWFDGQQVKVREFCETALSVTQQFMNEFDGAY
jgi:hypothetical protein